MATGSSARSSQPSTQALIPSFPSSSTSTPVPLYTRVRTRGRPVRDITTDSEEPRSKRTRSNGVPSIETKALELIVASIRSTDTGRIHLNPFERAIQLLQDEYELRLSENHFLQVVELLESQSKASIFITLKVGRLRDQWLCRNAGIELLDI
jgi:hypothetical protein